MYSTLSHFTRALASGMCVQLEKEKKRKLSHTHILSLTPNLSLALSLSRSLALSLSRSLAFQVFITKTAYMEAVDSRFASERTGNGGHTGPYARRMQTHKR